MSATQEENSKLWLALQEMPRPSQVVDFPRTGPDGKPIGQLRIWVLTQMELAVCHVEAEKFARKFLKEAKRDDLGYEAVFSNAFCVEVLFRACRDVDNPQRSAFPLPQSVQELSTEEVALLYDYYQSVQQELGPLKFRMSEAETEGLIERLMEGGAAFPFHELSSALQSLLLLTIVSRLGSLTKAKSSVGSPLDDGQLKTSES